LLALLTYLACHAWHDETGIGRSEVKGKIRKEWKDLKHRAWKQWP